MSLLNQVYEAKKPLICNVCGDSKKSVIGFLTHKVTCNRTDEQIDETKVPCTQCGDNLHLAHLVTHEKSHHQIAMKEKKKKTIDQQQNSDNSNKRKAAQRASLLINKVSKEEIGSEGISQEARSVLLRCFLKSLQIRNILKDEIEKSGSAKCFHRGCDLVFDQLDMAIVHLNDCERKVNPYFRCRICKDFFASKSLGSEHVEANHHDFVLELDVSSDDDRDDYSSNHANHANQTDNPLKLYWAIRKFQSLQSNKIQLLDVPKQVKSFSYMNTLKFWENNNSKGLFKNFPFVKSNWSPLNKNYIKNYLPIQKTSIGVSFTKTSPKTNFQVEEISFLKYKLFESTLSNGVSTIFCGGSITSLSWLPTPYTLKSTPQVLAVAIKPSADYKHFHLKRYKYKSLIEVWSFGRLDNLEEIKDKPRMVFSMAHNYGNVVSMEWCPSGCYDQEEGHRMGLLAVACTDSNVYCFSIGQCELYNEKIVKAKPSFKLVLSKKCDINLGNSDFYPTRISWSKAKEHKFLAIGYSQGLVALYNILSDNSWTQEIDNDERVQVFYPYQTFQAHRTSISGLCLHNMDKGNRWLATSSSDRVIKFWDLKDGFQLPFNEVKRATTKNLYWPLYALGAISSNDDSSNIQMFASSLIHVKDINDSQLNSLLDTNVCAQGLSVSDWGGLVYQGNHAGELTCCVMNNVAPILSGFKIKKYIFSKTSMHSEENNAGFEENTSYNASWDSSKVIFHDFNVRNGYEVESRDVFEKEVAVDKFPMRSINAIATNPNRYSFLFTAVGYNIGFVRVFHSKFMSTS